MNQRANNWADWVEGAFITLYVGSGGQGDSVNKNKRNDANEDKAAAPICVRINTA